VFNISTFFSRFQNSFKKEIFIREVVCQAIENQTKVRIPIEVVSFSGSSVVLKSVNQTLRSVIFIKKQNIIAEINQKQTGKVIIDIR